ncbi:MAG: SBBP repeat-containing protein, partial [Phycisphaerales bacterium]|nr:SBBP repeat-containing protein [Phycisphaerales bacterium]
GNQSRLEYDFLIAPRANPRQITLAFEGADGLSIDSEGKLVIRAGEAEIIHHKPVVYQDLPGGRREIEGRYRLMDATTVGFEIGAYDESQTLTIDPVLNYSTYIGGGDGDDDARAIATDTSGNVYMTGATTATNFRTVNALQPNAGNQDPELGLSDGFITKLNAAGTALVYSTYLGGSGDDDANAIAVDSSGNVIVVGMTGSMNFPTTAGAVRRTCNTGASGSCQDAFVAKLNAAGSALDYSTYLGGTGDDDARSVAVDTAGNAYIAGNTLSTNFTTTPGALSTDSSQGGFVTKLNPTGTVVYSTYFGAGAGSTEVRGIAVDAAGNVFVTGSSPSSPTTGTDVFLTKLNAAGTAALFSQFIRGSRDESGNAVAVDSAGNAYVTGQTASINFTTTAGVIQPGFGGGPAFRS